MAKAQFFARFSMNSVAAFDHDLVRMKFTDLPFVLKNERRGYTHPWSGGIFRDCVNSGYECWLLTYLGKVIGHGIMSIAAGESHVLNVCVHPECQGHGFGRIMVEHLIGRAREREVKRMYLEVRPSNLIAYKLYESLGFDEIGIRANYYPAFVGREDALVLGMDLLPD
jgi:ribosomal-protein-alanine N-acetyltransferase